MSSIILDFLDKSEGRKPVLSKNKKDSKQKPFGINDYRTILQNRYQHHKEKGNEEVMKELMKLLSAVATFGRDSKNIPRDIIDFILVSRGHTYNDVFEPVEGSKRPNQKIEYSFTRKLIAFFLYRWSGLTQESIARIYFKQSARNINYMIDDIREIINDEMVDSEVYELDSAIHDYLTTLYPRTKKQIKEG